MSKKYMLETMNDFSNSDASHFYNEHMKEFNNPKYSPRGVFMNVANFLLEDSQDLSYAKTFSDEVRGRLLKFAFDEYQRKTSYSSEAFLIQLKRERLTELYKKYYETTLNIDDYRDNGEKIREEIEKLRKELQDQP
ncbi:hypothetical protein FZD47_25535 [Bacillus infantis]|uniref:Uncharacterized protein n=1 Tax=Bacillus infantis TaxID=324767 RepID=A0A5D4RXW1_9BACI|nr:hypothetical protein [Bacillus infantis]TYS55790.1 hypothetical protein FZD47_25535 [Bacillus infantis]